MHGLSVKIDLNASLTSLARCEHTPALARLVPLPGELGRRFKLMVQPLGDGDCLATGCSQGRSGEARLEGFAHQLCVAGQVMRLAQLVQNQALPAGSEIPQILPGAV